MSKNLLAKLELAKQIAYEIGKLQLSFFEKDFRVIRKAPKELVTTVDMECQQLFYDLLKVKNKYPIFSEEVRNIGEIPEDYCWIVDPLDGSHNFIAGLPVFGVLIALVKNKRTVIGVIYLPYYDKLYTAVKSYGSYMNGEKIRVSTNNNLEKSMITYDNIFDNDKNILNRFKNITNKSFTVRITGSAIYDYCLVASGKIDSRIWNNSKMYDFAAGVLIVEEAGGKITDINGGPITLKSKDVVASNGLLHESILNTIK